MRDTLLLLSVCFALSGCGSGNQTATASSPSNQGATKTLTVFAAASLTESFSGIGKSFEAQNPGVKVIYNFGGSQQLLAQLQQGASADVFASASPTEMSAALKDGLVTAGQDRTFAHNRLVVIYSMKSKIAFARLNDLTRTGLKVVVADKSVPVGKYTLDMLEKISGDASFGAEFGRQVQANVVSREENVKAVLAKVKLGEADAGVVYATDAARASPDEIGVVEVPAAFNQTATYPLAPLKASAQPELAGQFVQFVLGAEGQKILASCGFASPEKTP